MSQEKTSEPSHVERQPPSELRPAPEEEASVTGIEPEDIESADRIVKPFDPTLIRVESKPMTLGQLISRIEHEEIDMAPDFQRKPGIWKVEAQSRLIESILIRIPIPAFYFDASDEDRWIVVDGLQRLTTITSFAIKKNLRLTGLEFLSTLEGETFDGLPRLFQRRIHETGITVFLIEKNTPIEVKFNIFKRINTGGVPLTSQEIRHALNQGHITKLLAELANSLEFRVATNFGIKDDRMADRECVIRFMAFAISPPANYKASDFDAFLSETMAEINKFSENDRSDLAARFLRVMQAASAMFNKGAFRKHADKSKPINKALFEAWTVNLDCLDDDEIAKLIERRDALISGFRTLCDAWAFNSAVSQGTGDTAKVKLRFASIKSLIKTTLS